MILLYNAKEPRALMGIMELMRSCSGEYRKCLATSRSDCQKAMILREDRYDYKSVITIAQLKSS
tara:strand:+ start:71 stop:262 length:192 start_codon:yes stop_codon:yes gene_type:complete